MKTEPRRNPPPALSPPPRSIMDPRLGVPRVVYPEHILPPGKLVDMVGGKLVLVDWPPKAPSA